MLFHCINLSLVDDDRHGITFCIFFFLEKNFKHSNRFKRRIPIYISIKYRSTFLYICVLLCTFLYICVYLYICHVVIGEHWRMLFCDKVNISKNCIFIFFLDFNFS